MALKRVLKLPTVVAASTGLALSTSSVVVEVQVAHYMLGGGAWIAIVIAGALSLLAGLCFAELNGILPSASGTRLYFSKAYNDRLSLTVSLFYVFALSTVVGVEGFVLSKVLSGVFPFVPPFLWVTAMIAIVVTLNIRGIKTAGRFQDVITYGMVAALFGIAVLGVVRNGANIAHPLGIPSAGGLISAIAVGVFLFVGFEWVAPLAEEVTQVKVISKGMLIVIGILNIVYGLFTMAMTATVPMRQLVGSTVPQLLFAKALLGPVGVAIMVAITIAASFGLFNAGTLTTSRFVYATAREHALPSGLAKISRYMTPWVAVLLMGAIGIVSSALIFLTGRYMTLVDVGAAVESIVFALCGLAVFRLRRKMPDAERPFTVLGGSFVPIATFVIFAILTVAVVSQDVPAAVYVVLGLLVSSAYVRWVVPGMKERHAAAAAARRAAMKRGDPTPASELRPVAEPSVEPLPIAEPLAAPEPEPGQ